MTIEKSGSGSLTADFMGAAITEMSKTWKCQCPDPDVKLQLVSMNTDHFGRT